MFSPPNYSSAESFLAPRLGPWTVLLYLHRKPILDAVMEAAPRLGGRLLDIGCGQKPYASILQCTEHVGVDVATSPVQRARCDAIYDGDNLPFRDSRFDSALCTEVLEHCSKPLRVISEISRVLKPGGYLLVTVPMVMHHHEQPRDFWRFTRYGLEELGLQAGLAVVWVKSRGGIYTAALAAFYQAFGLTLSRRPFSDLVLWAIRPAAVAVRIVEALTNKPVAITLGWQILLRKER